MIIYAAAAIAGLIVVVTNKSELIVTLALMGPWVVLPWLIALQQRMQTDFISTQDLLLERLDDAEEKISELKHQMNQSQSEASALAQRVRRDALEGLLNAQRDWAMLLSAERELFASQIRSHQRGE